MDLFYEYRGDRPNSQNSFQELDLLAEEQLWRQKTEQSTQQHIGDVTELKSKLDNQLKDAYRDISTYRAQAEQLTADLRAERARREKAERDLVSVQDSADQLTSDLAEARLENGHLANLSTHSGGGSSLMQELAEARQQAERAIRARDRAQDQVAELEEACAELEKLAAPATKEQKIRDQMKLLHEQKVSMMEKMIKEESRNFDEAVTKMAALEAERDDAIVQVQRLQVLIKELRSDTSRTSRTSRRSSTSPRSASTYGGNDDRWAGRSAYATEALVQAALRMTQIETENERLRQQLQSRHEASRADGTNAETVQSLRRQLAFAEGERDQLEAELEARAPAFPDDHQMTEILLSRQEQMHDMKVASQNLREFAHNVVADRQAGYAGQAKDALTDFDSDLSRLESLPSGWETMVTRDGVEYYVDHNTKHTQWVHPLHVQKGLGYTLPPSGAAAPGSPIIVHTAAREQPPRRSATSSKLAKFQSRTTQNQ